MNKEEWEGEELLAENGPRSTLPTTANSIKFSSVFLSLSFFRLARDKEKEKSNRVVSVSCDKTASNSKRRRERESEWTKRGNPILIYFRLCSRSLNLLRYFRERVCRSVVAARAFSNFEGYV